MSDEYGQLGADPAGNHPTQQFWAGPDAPAATPASGQPASADLLGPAGAGFTGYSALGLPEPKGKHHRKALHWTAGLLAAVLLAGGGMIAGMRLAAHSSPGTS